MAKDACLPHVGGGETACQPNGIGQCWITDLLNWTTVLGNDDVIHPKVNLEQW